MTKPTASRRQFLRALLATPAALFLAACGRLLGQDAPTEATATPETAVAAQTDQPIPTLPPRPVAAQTDQPTPTLSPTPACADDDDVTPPQTAGPFFTPDSPERTSLREAGIQGMPLVLTGAVVDTNCRSIAGALLDFWHADDSGNYDNEGYRLRGHQFADDQGRFRLETIIPGLYPGRTRHFHVKVQAPNQPVLTTQLYFPDEPGNAQDGIFDPELLMAVDESDGEVAAAFDFVLDVN